MTTFFRSKKNFWSAPLMSLFLCPLSVIASQPPYISLNSGAVSLIYPPFDTPAWTLTQYSTPASEPRDHNGDDYFAQDWARGCGTTAGNNVFAAFSGLVVIAEDEGSVAYGRTVVIYDAESQFAIRYGHLQSMFVSVGDVVIAGVTKIGVVGNTGNVHSNTCSVEPGAHLHISLYQNVSNPNAEPVTSVSIANPSASQYAANFSYVASAQLIKGDADPTVYVFDGNNYLKDFISAYVYSNQGWGFWINTNVSPSPPPFNSVGTYSQNSVNGVPTGPNYPPRDGTLVRGQNDPTVYIILQGQKVGVPGNIFSCRNFSFASVQTTAQGEVDSYPASGAVLIDCIDHDKQALADMLNIARQDPRVARQATALSVFAGTYGTNTLWGPDWELRWVAFLFNSNYNGTWMIYYNQATYKAVASLRYTSFYDPDAGGWTNWQMVQ